MAEFDRRLATTRFSTISLAHSRNVLRHLGDGPKRASQLVAVAGVTKQAISQQVSYLAANGLVTVALDPGDQRAHIVTLTAEGERAQRTVRAIFTQIEQDWRELLAADLDFDALLDQLATVMQRVRAAAAPAAGGGQSENPT